MKKKGTRPGSPLRQWAPQRGLCQAIRETRDGHRMPVAVGASREPCRCSQCVLEEGAAGWIGRAAGWGRSWAWRGREVLRPVRLGLGPDLRVPDGRGEGISPARTPSDEHAPSQ